MRVRIIECGSTQRASKITESTGLPKLVDESLSLECYVGFGTG